MVNEVILMQASHLEEGFFSLSCMRGHISYACALMIELIYV